MKQTLDVSRGAAEAHMMEHDGSQDNKVYQSSFIEQLQYRCRNKLTAVGFFSGITMECLN